MKKIKFISLFLIVILLHCSIAHAVNLNVSLAPDPANPVAACRNNIFSASVSGFSTTDPIVVEIQNEIHLNGSPITTYPCIPGQTSGNYPVYGELASIPVTGGTVTAISYTGQSFYFTITPAVGSTSVNFSYNIYIDCSAIPTSLTSNIDYFQTWNATILMNPVTFIINSQTIQSNVYVSSSIDFPYINLQTSSLTQTVSYGQTVYLTFEYKNLGDESAISFASENNNLCASAYTIIETKYALNSDPFSNTLLLNNSIYMEHDDVLKIRQEVQITGCLPCTTSVGVFKWKCEMQSTGTTFCSECQNMYETGITLWKSNTLPQVSAYRILPDQNGGVSVSAFRYWDVACHNTNTPWLVRVKNTGLLPVPLTEFAMGLQTLLPAFNSIDISSVSYSYYDNTNTLCPTCSTNQVTLVTTAATGTNFVCAPGTPLEAIQLTVTDFPPGDYIELAFTMNKCCSEDDALLNQHKIYNPFNASLSFTDECSVERQGVMFSNGTLTDEEPLITAWDNHSITSNNYPGPNGGDLHLSLQFTPTITDLSVPPLQTFGSSADLSMNLNGLLQSPYDAQAIGVPSALAVGSIVSAILRVKINCDDGLRIENLTDAVHLRSNLGAGLELTSIACYKATNTNQCQADDYYYYFPISSGQDIINYINNGRLDFRLMSCCGPGDNASYSVTYHLMSNIANCGSVFQPNDTVTPPTCTSCCWIPLSSAGSTITVHCPGCKSPGIIVDAYQMRRTTLGYEDSDNNRVADNPLTQITTSSPNYAFLDLDYAAHGDEMEDVMTAHFQEGDDINGGYLYADMLAADPNNELDYLQLRRMFSQKTGMTVVITGFDLIIEDPILSSPNCLQCASSCTVGYNTVLSMSVSGAGMTPFLDQSTSATDFFFTFNKADILAYQLINGGTFTEFKPCQKYRLVTRYKVCGNHSDPAFLQNDITNALWLTGIEQPYNAFPALVPYQPNLMPSSFGSDFADTHVFICETFGGRNFFTGYSMSMGNEHFANSAKDKCIPSLRYVVQVAGTNDYFNLYPFEIRVPSIIPTTFTFNAPPSYEIINMMVFSRFSSYNFTPNPALAVCYSNQQNLTGVTYPAGTTTTTFNTSNLPGALCVSNTTQVCSANPLAYSDNEYRLYFDVFLRNVHPNCTPPAFQLNGTSGNAVFADNTVGCGSISNGGCTPFSLTVSNYNIHGSTLNPPTPNLSVNFSPTNIQVGTNTICWSFQITNSTGTAQNAFLGVPSTNPLYSYFSNWTLTLTLNGTPVPVSFNAATGFFSLGAGGALPSSQLTYTGTLCVDYDDCQGTGNFPVYWGWNCNGIPTQIPLVPSPCFYQVSNLSFEDIVVDILPGVPPLPSTYSPCELITGITANFQLFAQVGSSGYVTPYEIQFGTLPTGLTLPSTITLVNCSTLASVTITNAGGWLITTTDLMTLFGGNPYLSVGECLDVVVDYIPSCEYAGALPSITLLSRNYCNDPLTDMAVFTPAWTPVNTGCCFSCEELSLNYIEKEDCNFSFNAIVPANPNCASTEIAWDFGDGGTGTGTSVTHQYLTNGSFVVCYTWRCFDRENQLIDTCVVCEKIIVECASVDTFCLKIPKDFDMDLGEGIMTTPDGGFAVGGTLHEVGTGGDRDMYIVKYSPNITQDFFTTAGDRTGAVYKERGYSILVYPDGYFVAGSVDMGSQEDVFVAKFRLDGTLDYGMRYGSPALRSEGAYRIIDMSSGGSNALLVVGYAEIATGDTNMLALKIDPADLGLIAENTYYYNPPTSISQEKAYDAVKTGWHTMTDHYAIVGEQYVGKTDKNVMVTLINTNLGLLHGKVYASSKRSDVGYGIAAYDTSLFVTGSTSYDGNPDDLLILRMSIINLNYQENAVYTDRSGTHEIGKKIILDKQKNLVIVGTNWEGIITSGPDALVMKVKPGDITTAIWSRSTTLQPFTERFHSIAEYGNDHYIATGSYVDAGAITDEDIFIVKMTKDSGFSCCLNPYPMKAKSTTYTTRPTDEKKVTLKTSPHGLPDIYKGDDFICSGSVKWHVRKASAETGLSDATECSLFPNPNTGGFVIRLNKGAVSENIYTVNITDISGRIVATYIKQADDNLQISVDARNVVSGIYFVEIINAELRWKSKVVIEK